MTEVKAGSSSAQDAGKATTSPDLSIVQPEGQANASDKQSKETAKPSDDTSKEVVAPVVETKETEKEATADAETTETESEETDTETETDDEGTQDDGKSAHLKQKQEAHAARKIQEVSQQLKEAQQRLEQFENTQERLVRSNVNYLYTIAQSDKELADKLVTKIFAQTHGVETLEELKLLADRNKAADPYKPLYDQQLAVMKELRVYRQKEAERQASEKDTALKVFGAANPEFKGDVKKKTLDILERSKGSFTLEESFHMAKGLVGVKGGTEQVDTAHAEMQTAKNKAGTRGGGESKAGMGNGKAITQAQLEMAKRFKLDPAKVYKS